MYHTAAYLASVTDGKTNAALDALTDNVFRIGASNGFVMQEPMMLMAALAAPNNGTAFRLFSPKLAQFGYEQCNIIQAGAKTANGLLVNSWPYRPFTFRNQEEVTAFVDTGGTAAADEALIVSLANSVDQVPPGELLTLAFSSTTAAVANAWTILTYTLSQTLPEGRYAMLASELQSTNAIAHRWTFWGQYYRPGMPSTTAYSNQRYPGVTDFRHGLMGQFSNVTLPNIEVLCSSTDSSHTGYIHALKVA